MNVKQNVQEMHFFYFLLSSFTVTQDIDDSRKTTNVIPDIYHRSMIART